jgi:hypothetical protein
VVKQEPSPQTYGSQETGVPGVQFPAPSQVAAGVKVSPTQVVAPQVASLPGKVQVAVWTPSHSAEPQNVPSNAHKGRPLSGTPFTAKQWPARLQASHWPVQAASQQTPSVQKPEAQSLATSQGWPNGRSGRQAPLSQWWVATQSASEAQVVTQAVAPQT